MHTAEDVHMISEQNAIGIPCGREPMSYVYSVLCIRLFFCRGIRSMAIRSLHLLVRARTGGQMLIAEIKRPVVYIDRNRRMKVFPSGHRLPACLFFWDSSRVMGICRLVCSLQKGTIMENANVQNAAAITDKTTLGELLAMLDLADRLLIRYTEKVVHPQLRGWSFFARTFSVPRLHR